MIAPVRCTSENALESARHVRPAPIGRPRRVRRTVSHVLLHAATGRAGRDVACSKGHAAGPSGRAPHIFRREDGAATRAARVGAPSESDAAGGK